MVTLTNPLNNDVTIEFKGVDYTIPANGSQELPDDVALYWVTMIHKFLIVNAQVDVVAPTSQDGTAQMDAPASDDVSDADSDSETKSSKKSKK